jgi:energy-coupling factor transport system permease protein
MLMRVLDLARPTGRLAVRNPFAKVLLVVPPTVVLLLSIDVVTPLVLVALTVTALPWAQVPWRRLALQLRLLTFAVVTVGVVNIAFTGDHRGRHLLDLGPVHVTGGSVAVGVAIALRALGVALPGIVVLAATDPVDLTDSLVQQGRLPARFAYGTLAALRLMPLLAQEWDQVAMARRARGIDAGHSPVRGVRLFASQVFGLLVAAIRRATRLATAMDARGFDAGLPRTTARRQVVTRADLVMVGIAVAGSIAAPGISLLLGTWRPVVG